jgi:hypothetical protein
MHPARHFLSVAPVLGVAALLVSCGGGGGGTPAPVPSQSGPTLTALQGPECITDTSGRWVSTLKQPDADSPSAPARKFFMAVRYVHAIDTPITSNFARLGEVNLTNFDPEAGVLAKDYGRWQRGRVDGDASVTSGFQMKCDEVGSVINTATFARQSIVGAGPHSAYFYDFRDPADPLTLSKLPAAFDADPATDLVLQAQLEIPWLQRSGPPDDTATGSLAIAQVTLAAYLRDARSGKLFAYAVMLYQNAPQEQPQVAHDEEVAYVSTPSQTNEFITMSPQSAGYSSATWTGLKPYRVHISQAKFAHALTKVNAFCALPENRARSFCLPGASSTNFSADPVDYQLVAFGMLHEVFTGRPDNNVASGVHYKDVGAWRAR